MTRYHPPRITRHRGAWAVSYYEDGKRCRASLGTDDLDEARRRFAVWRKAERNTSFKRPSIIYFIRCNAPQAFIKIGIARELANRLSMLQIGCPYDIDVVATMPGNRAAEAALHERFAHLRERGEWFREAPDLLDFVATLAPAPAIASPAEEDDPFGFTKAWRDFFAEGFSVAGPNDPESRRQRLAANAAS